MKYNRSEIMKTAWQKHRRFGMDMSTALRLAWYDAKEKAARYDVYGVNLDGTRVLLAHCVDCNRAGELKWFNANRFDRVEQIAA